MKSYLVCFGVLLIVSSCGSPEVENQLTPEEITKLKEDQEIQKEKEAQELEAQRLIAYSWKYSESEDEMSSKVTRFANVTSEDVAYLDFPYEGGTFMTLHVREGAKGLDAFIKVSQGQLHTNYRNPTLTLKFDDNEAKSYSVSEEASGDSEYLFFDYPKGIVDKLKSADTTKIQCMFYNEGNHVFTFNTANFDW